MQAKPIKLSDQVREVGKEKKYKGKETKLQQTAIKHISRLYDPEVYHVPNGGSRHLLEAIRLKREGVRKGIPDVVSDLPSGSYHGLRIELKVAGGKLSQDQIKILNTLAERGYYCAVVWNVDGLAQVCKDYYKEAIPHSCSG